MKDFRSSSLFRKHKKSLDSITGKLGIYQISSGQKSTMSTAIMKIKSDVSKSCLTMRYDPFLTDADWELVNAKSLLAYPYKANQRYFEILSFAFIKFILATKEEKT